MIVTEKNITLRDGRTARLASPEVGDAAALLNCAKTCFGETDYLSRYPEEFTVTVEQEAAWIESARQNPDTALIACTVDGRLVGNGQIDFSPLYRTRHRAIIALSVLRAAWGFGIGSALLTEMLELARRRGVEIVELTCVEGNDRARRLYEKFGFATVCEKPFAYKYKDGRYASGFTMQCRVNEVK